MTLIKQPTEPIIVSSIVALLYGQPGIGKTTWSLTAPDPLLLDFDNGMRRVQPVDRKAFVPVTSWEEAVKVVESEDLSAFRTLVVDTAGMALDFLAIKIIRENPKLGIGAELSLKGYGKLKSDFRAFVSLCKSKGKNLVFVAHDRESSDGDSKYIRPDITGGSLSLLTREADLVGYMEAVGNQRTVSFTPTSRAYGKNTGGLPPVIELSKMKLASVFNEFQVQQDNHSGVLDNYNDLLGIIEEKVSRVTSPETAGEVAKEIEILEVIWDSRLVARTRFRLKLTELGLKYNPLTQAYEAI